MKFIVIFSLIAYSESQNGYSFRPLDWLCFKPILCDDEKNYHLNRIIKRIEGSFSMRENIIFLLNKKNVKDYPIQLNDQQSLIDSGFDPNLPTRVIIHGFLNNATSRINKVLSKGFLRHSDFNVIKVAWGRGSKTFCYDWAKKRVRIVGSIVAEFMDFILGNDSLKWKQLTIVGHSLGAHIAGMVGKKVKLGKVGTIFGLDPAAPLFRTKDIRFRLSKSDAEYVEIIHTNGHCLGMRAAIGTADFYVNGGDEQPGCFNDLCDHGRSIELFRESIGKNNTFYAKPCKRRKFIVKPSKFVLMGGESGEENQKNISGTFCLITRNRRPFGIGKRRIPKEAAFQSLWKRVKNIFNFKSVFT